VDRFTSDETVMINRPFYTCRRIHFISENASCY